MSMASLADVTEAMKDVIDPELGINVVDLGLIYDITIDDANVAVLDMTLTSAACPLQDVIEDQTRSVLQDLVTDVRINWVWMPPWGPDKITDDGREQLRAIGFTV
jgi:metal-sulfur cluster biosynthetic enzyme